MAQQEHRVAQVQVLLLWGGKVTNANASSVTLNKAGGSKYYSIGSAENGIYLNNDGEVAARVGISQEQRMAYRNTLTEASIQGFTKFSGTEDVIKAASKQLKVDKSSVYGVCYKNGSVEVKVGTKTQYETYSVDDGKKTFKLTGRHRETGFGR